MPSRNPTRTKSSEENSTARTQRARKEPATTAAASSTSISTSAQGTVKRGPGRPPKNVGKMGNQCPTIAIDQGVLAAVLERAESLGVGPAQYTLKSLISECVTQVLAQPRNFQNALKLAVEARKSNRVGARRSATFSSKAVRRGKTLANVPDTGVALDL